MSKLYEALETAERERQGAVKGAHKSPIEQPVRKRLKFAFLLSLPRSLTFERKLLPNEVPQVEEFYRSKCRPYRLILRPGPGNILTRQVCEACRRELGKKAVVFLRDIWSDTYYRVLPGNTRRQRISIVDIYYLEENNS